jgi:hypothetical protein
MSVFSTDRESGTKILEGLGAAQENFKIVATNVRQGQPANNYILQDGPKLQSIVEKWRFEPKQDPLSRCGYDYQVVVANGDVTVNMSICFLCKTLVVDHKDKYAVTKKQILNLFSEDFEVLR